MRVRFNWIISIINRVHQQYYSKQTTLVNKFLLKKGKERKFYFCRSAIDTCDTAVCPQVSSLIMQYYSVFAALITILFWASLHDVASLEDVDEALIRTLLRSLSTLSVSITTLQPRHSPLSREVRRRSPVLTTHISRTNNPCDHCWWFSIIHELLSVFV